MFAPFVRPSLFFRRHIGARIMAGFSLISLLALLVALVSLANVAAVNHRLDESAQRDRHAAANALRLQLAIEQQSDGVRGFLLSGDERFLASFEAGAALFDETIGALEAELPHPESAQRLEEIRFLEARFREVARQQITFHRQGWSVSAIYLWNVSGRARQDEVQNAIQAYAGWQEVVVGEELEAARARSNLATIVALALVALAGLISTVVSVVLTRSITRPIRALARIAGIIKGGNLNVQVPVMGSDEIGTLSQTIGQMAASLDESRRSLEASLRETEVRNRELLALNTVAAAAVALDRQQLLDTTLETVLELTGVEFASIHLQDAAGTLQPIAQRGLSETFLKRVPYAAVRGMLANVLATGNPITVDDDSTEPAELLTLVRAEGMRSAVAVPIRSQGAAFGVLALGSGRGRRFGFYDVGLLTSIANQIGVAIENTMLLFQREQRITTLSVVNEVSRAISAVLDMDTLYAVIYEQCRRSLDVPNFVIASWETEVEALTPCLLYIDGQRMNLDEGWPYTPALLTVVANTRQPLLTNDYHATCRALGISTASHIRSDERRSLLGVPMTIGERLAGVILVSTTATTYSEEDRDLLAAIANQAAVAMENARLYQALQERLAQVEGISAVGTALIEERDLQGVLRTVGQQVLHLLGAAGCSIALLEPDETARVAGEELELVMVLGSGEGILEGRRLPLAGSFSGEAIRRGSPVISEDAQHDARGFAPTLRAAGINAVLTVPMQTSQHMVGALNVHDPRGRRFGPRDVETLTLFAQQAAVAIENAQLYEQTRELGVIEERNRLAREIHDTIAQGLTGIVLQLEAAGTLIDMKPERARQRLAKATELARNTLTEARRSVWNLRPAPLEESSLLEAIQAEGRRLSDDGLRVATHVQGDPAALAPGVENGLYRITQEALQNIRKHARASRVEVTLDWSGNHLTLTVEDDGRGFDPAALTGHRVDGGGFGLLGMRERARLLGGTLDIHSTPGAGTSLQVRVPLAGQAGIPKPTQPTTPTSTRALIP